MALDEEQAKALLVGRCGVSRETLDRLEAYRELLLKWSNRINLVGPATLEHFWARHALDSAQLLPLAGPNNRTWLDMGTGAGFPGLVIAAMIREQPSALVVLVEPNAKRCAFLREAARILSAPVEIHCGKIENLSHGTVDVVTARAFTALDRLLTLSEPFCAPSTKRLFLKGAEVRAEIDKASTNWTFQSRLHPSLSDPRGCVLEINGAVTSA